MERPLFCGRRRRNCRWSKISCSTSNQIIAYKLVQVTRTEEHQLLCNLPRRCLNCSALETDVSNALRLIFFQYHALLVNTHFVKTIFSLKLTHVVLVALGLRRSLQSYTDALWMDARILASMHILILRPAQNAKNPSARSTY